MNKKILIIFIFTFFTNILNAQDTILKNIFLKDVIILSTRTNSKLENIPASIDVIAKEEIENYPSTNIDNLLQSVSNVYVNRSWGIFSKNSSVTMRGMDGTNRVLVLYNGIPLNKTSGGGINWYMIQPETVEKIEVLKGSNSALYGNNAMSGIINIISEIPKEKFKGNFKLLYGGYQTFGSSIHLSGNQVRNNRGWYWYANGFWRKGDGYIMVPKETRDSNDSKLGINEFSSDAQLGYQFNEKTKLTVNYNFYTDNRSDGIKIYEKEGGFQKSFSNLGMLNFSTIMHNGILFNAKAFYHYDYFWQHTEKLNETGDTYKMYDTDQYSNDMGLWLNVTRNLGKINKLTLGADFKHGNMDAEDIYRTSTDNVKRKGNISFAAAFLQDEIAIGNKWNIVAALRYDYAGFNSGSIVVDNPSYNTGFLRSFAEDYPSNHWMSLSPKISAKYNFSNKVDMYISASKGFMPATLDDMCSSRKITKGFKEANPQLKPEYVFTYEIGNTYKPTSNLMFESSIYFSEGKDFQYFVATGEIVDNTSIVLKRENIGKVNIAGFEISAKYQWFKNTLLKCNYTYNHSEIVEFNALNETGVNLKGKHIAEIPAHQVFIGLFNRNKWINSSIIFNYVGEQWVDEQNSATISDHFTIDLRLYREWNKRFTVSLDLQNLLDDEFIDKKGGLSPGRYFELEIGVKF
jgi:iron complex outermembrane receptor protein